MAPLRALYRLGVDASELEARLRGAVQLRLTLELVGPGVIEEDGRPLVDAR